MSREPVGVIKPNRLSGHTLPHEGRVMIVGRHANGDGFGKCSCGATSRMPLPNTAARQRWHRSHKDDVRARLAASPEVGSGPWVAS